MNRYVVNTKDYNRRENNGHKLPYYWEDKPSEPLNCFYDFGSEKPVHIGEFRLDLTEFSPLQEKMWEAGKDL